MATRPKTNPLDLDFEQIEMLAKFSGCSECREVFERERLQMRLPMPMKKIEDPDRKHFYWRCETCGYRTEEKKKTRENVDEKPPRCPRCGN